MADGGKYKGVRRALFLDALRGLAVLMMIVFHLAVDLEDFYDWPIGYRAGAWEVFRILIVTLFLGVSGWAAGAGLAKRHTRSGLKLLAAAILVSAATYVFDRESYVRFGILHFIAVATLLLPFFDRLPDGLLVVLAAGAVAAGRYFSALSVDTPWLLPLGIVPRGFSSMDYYPLLPWLALFIAGILAGRRLGVPDMRKGRLTEGLACVGRYSLFIYLVHQPLLLLSLQWLAG